MSGKCSSFWQDHKRFSRSAMDRAIVTEYLRHIKLYIYVCRAYVIMENSTHYKYKTVKDIKKPAGIYHYITESSWCAKFYRNRLTHFGWANGGSFSFFLLTHTQTNKFFHLAYRSQIWTELNELMFITRGFRCRCAIWGSRRWSITFRGPDPQK